MNERLAANGASVNNNLNIKISHITVACVWVSGKLELSSLLVAALGFESCLLLCLCTGNMMSLVPSPKVRERELV